MIFDRNENRDVIALLGAGSMGPAIARRIAAGKAQGRGRRWPTCCTSQTKAVNNVCGQCVEGVSHLLLLYTTPHISICMILRPHRYAVA